MADISRRLLLGCALAGLAAGSPSKAGPMTAYDFSFTAIEGGPLPLSAYRGDVLLVVNTASFCGYTGQYAGLQELWQRYRDRGLVVLGVPSNDFGAQEPGSEAEIKTFCETTFAVDFPLAAKEQVKGAGAHPFYRWALEDVGEGPKWNFHKYLIDRSGQISASYGSSTAPESGELVGAIEALLDGSPAG